MTELGEKCAVFALIGLNAVYKNYEGLKALQHRGQYSCGIAYSLDGVINVKKGLGLVREVFKYLSPDSLEGNLAIGHNRYATFGGDGHVQPVIVEYAHNKRLAFVHNGNLPVTDKLERFLHDRGISTAGRNDSEMMALAIASEMKRGAPLSEARRQTFPLFEGAHTTIASDGDEINFMKDRQGIRPGVIGRLRGNYVFSSESYALDVIGADYVRELNPGEMVSVRGDKITSEQLANDVAKLCLLEYVYFAHEQSLLTPASNSFLPPQRIKDVRFRLGQALGQVAPVKADMVIGVPNSALSAAKGYSNATGIPLNTAALRKNPASLRTFIEQTQTEREARARSKFVVDANAVKDKWVAVVDDSIVRGTNISVINERLWQAGVRGIHVLSTSDRFRFPNFHGFAIETQEELIAASHSDDEICKIIKADSLYFLPLEYMIPAIGVPKENLTMSSLNGIYPTSIGDKTKHIRYHIPERQPSFVFF